MAYLIRLCIGEFVKEFYREKAPRGTILTFPIRMANGEVRAYDFILWDRSEETRTFTYKVRGDGSEGLWNSLGGDKRVVSDRSYLKLTLMEYQDFLNNWEARAAYEGQSAFEVFHRLKSKFSQLLYDNEVAKILGEQDDGE